MQLDHHSTDRPTLGMLLMITGVASFAVMDATIKWLTTDFSVPQIVALRSWFGLPILFFLVHREGGITELKTKRPFAHGFRYMLVLILSFSFFWVLSRMKLVDAITITFAAPIIIAALSVPLLKESVGIHRWSAIIVGFIGVLVILRPGYGVFQWAALVALGSTAAYAILMITTRALKSTETTASLMFYPQFCMSITGLLYAPFFWITPSLWELALFAFAGTIGSFGIICITNAFRLAPVATVSPFEYTALIWATLLGYLIWNELPDSPTLFGAGIVITSGLYILYRETRLTGKAQPKLVGLSPDDTGQ
jgi:drug/metabolite transporter (DMT)-like permease